MNTAIEQTTAVTDAPLQLVLTVDEQAALLECEAIIRQGRAVFVQVGHALSRIRDSRLYRVKYSTFEDYCLEEWEISDRFARNLRSAADVVHVLGAAHGHHGEPKFSVLPVTESQARPLTKLPREEWAGAWHEVLADGQRVTASRVVEVVQRRLNRIAGVSGDTEIVKKPTIQSPQPKVIDSGTREERVRASLNHARASLRDLSDLIGTADGMAASGVVTAIHGMDELQDYLSRKQDLLDSRKPKPEEAAL